MVVTIVSVVDDGIHRPRNVHYAALVVFFCIRCGGASASASGGKTNGTYCPVGSLRDCLVSLLESSISARPNPLPSSPGSHSPSGSDGKGRDSGPGRLQVQQRRMNTCSVGVTQQPTKT